MHRLTGWWDEHQVPLYLAAMLGGVAAGLGAPGIAPALEASINPVLALLLFATFLGVPLTEVGRGLTDARFLLAIAAANFLAVPLIAFGLSRLVAGDRGLLLGVLLVLLTPCVDYVIVFTRLAGGARARLLAATPLLMLLQMALLPLYLLLFAGREALGVIDVGPFLEAFLVLIVVPLAAAAGVQALGRRHPAGSAVEAVMAGAMVPLMMATLAVVIGSQIAGVGGQAGQLTRLIPLYAAFLVLAVAVGLAAGRIARLDAAARRAVAFSAATRNSLVVLPLALALPEPLALAPLAVVTQTLVELLGMVILVRLMPRLVPHGAAAAPG